MKKYYPFLLLVMLFAVRSEKIEFNIRVVSSYGEYSQYYNTKYNYLACKYSTKLFNLDWESLRPASLTSLLNETVIVDTLVINQFKRGKDYYIRTVNPSVNNLLCELKCTRAIYNEIDKSNNKHFLLAVKADRINSQQRVMELDSIDKKSLFVQRGSNVVLQGECLEAVELPNNMITTNE